MARGPVYKGELREMRMKVPVELHTALMELSEAIETPATRFVISMLMEQLPTIRGLTEAAIAAKQGKADALGGLSRQLLQAINQGAQLALEIEEHKAKGAAQ